MKSLLKSGTLVSEQELSLGDVVVCTTDGGSEWEVITWNVSRRQIHIRNIGEGFREHTAFCLDSVMKWKYK